MVTTIDIEKLKAGDPDAQAAFFEFVQTQLPSLHRMARAYGCDLADAEDIVQDAMITLLRSVDRISSIDSANRLRAYLTLVVRNKILDLRRKNMRREQILSADEPAAVAPPYQSEHEQMELMELIREAVGMLSERERLIVEHRIAGMTSKETAITLGCSERTVQMLWCRARKHLQDILRKKGVVE